MRRRGKRGHNNSEATGKIGQEIPQDQPAALQPSYSDNPGRGFSPKRDENNATDLQAAAASAGEHDASPSETPDAPAPGKIEVETQPDSLGVPPAEPQAVVAGGDKAVPRGYVVLAIGLPGSGKTTWYKRRGVTPLSSDMLRTILFDDITDQRYSGLVFSTLRSLLRARLIAKMPWNYVDATNLSAHERRQWIKMAKSFGYEAQAVYFDVPLAVCLERNSKRERRVADDVMQKMAERLRPPSFKEGFSKITVVRVKGQPGGAAVPTAEAFNAPVPADLDESNGAQEPKDLDEPSGMLEDAESGEDAVIDTGFGDAPARHDRKDDKPLQHQAGTSETDKGEALEGRAEALSVSPREAHASDSVSGEASDEPSGRLQTLESGETPVR